MKTIGFIGAGNMAFALAGAFLAGNEQIQVAVSDPSAERKALFQKNFDRVSLCDNNHQLIEKSDIIILAVKPQILPAVLVEIGDPETIVISIAAGIRLSVLESSMPKSTLVRVMPNTPCLVGEMAAGAVFADGTDEAVQSEVISLLSLAGTVISVREDQMDAVTGVSGSGPAFVARLIEAFINAGVNEGLSAEEARALTLTTFSGTANLLKDREMSPAELVAMVSSPNGTTVAGRSVLEESNYRSILENTVEAAAQRSRELGK